MITEATTLTGDFNYRVLPEELVDAVREAIRELAKLQVPAESIWLNEERRMQFNSLLGLPVRYHSFHEEFVLAPMYGRCMPIRFSPTK